MSDTAKCDRCDGPMLIEDVMTQAGYVVVDYCSKCKWSPLVNPAAQKELSRLKTENKTLRHEMRQQRSAWIKLATSDGYATIMAERAQTALGG